MSNLYEALTNPFPPEAERILRKGGAALTYIPVSEVITRLNKVLGVDRWSFDIISCKRDELDPDYIVAHVRLTWYTGNPETWTSVDRDGYGGQKIKRTKSGEIVDLGDEMKGAVSDALKKAAQTLGVGLYLARSEEAMYAEMESEMESEPQVVAPAASQSDELVKLWDAFTSFTKNFSSDQKAKLREIWNEYSDGAPIPKLNSVSIEDAEFLHAQAAELAIIEKFSDE